jgi:tetratricopeptide (TPR) repeat protein
MNRKTVLSVVLTAILTSTLSAQTVPPTLVVPGEKQSESLRLARVAIEVRIHGYLAETTTSLTFGNSHPRALEGDLYFPLPEGATVSGYALDVGGRMVDGVVVEKEKGRVVFEAVERRGIDPGLIEWTKGNNFQTRVFPIPANGSRTVRVSYVSELVGPQNQPAYYLPLNYRQKIDEFTLRVEVVKPAAKPAIRQGAPANFAFQKWRESYLAETRLSGAQLSEPLVVALPEVEKQPVLVEQAGDKEFYFVIHDQPEMPVIKQLPQTPKHIVLYWDASGSRGPTDHQRELRLLKAYFDSWRPAAAPQPGGANSKQPGRISRTTGPTRIDVDLVLLRNAQSEPKRLVVNNGNASQLLDELQKVQYDGGTQLAAITPRSGAAKPDFYFLFTDGLSNFGKVEPCQMDAPVYVFSADVKANHGLLRRLGEITGGRYFNLQQLDDQTPISAIGQPSFQFLGVDVESGQVAELYPSRPQPVEGRFTLVGKLKSPKATATLKYGFSGEVVSRRSFVMDRADAVEGSLLRCLWAQKKLAELMVFEKQNEEQILKLGKQYGLVTPQTSLIVLDSLEQYVEHEIEPPASLPEMREEYQRRIDTLEHQKSKEKADKLDAAIRLWEERVQWWNTSFKYPQDFKYTEKSGGQMGGGMGGAAGVPAADAIPGAEPPAPAAIPPAAPAPAAPAEAAASERTEHESLDLAPKRDESGRGEGQREPGIVIKPWDPDTPYLKELKAADAKDVVAVYMKNRSQYGASPAFYLDCADFFAGRRQEDMSLQVLSNIAELELEDASLLRILGHRLGQLGYLDLAALTFEEVLKLRPEEPQSYRDLALVLARRAERLPADATPKRDASAVRGDYQHAIELLYQIVTRPWDDRFAEIELIALTELNCLLPKAKTAGVENLSVDPRLIKLLDFDVRIVMTWHADNTDMDLWVVEPSGEKAYYGHNNTTIGGRVSRDFTGGYGPEEYLVRRAMHGMYTIQTNYFGSRAAQLIGPVTVQVDVFTNYGRPSQQHRALTVRLEERQDTVTIGQIEY